MKNIAYMTAILIFSAIPARGLESTISANNLTLEQIATSTGLAADQVSSKPIPFSSPLWWRNLCCMENHYHHGVFSSQCRTPEMQSLMARCSWTVTP